MQFDRKGVQKRVIRKIEMANEIVRIAQLSGWRAGKHVTEAELNEALGVSRSPVRLALSVLGERGVVVRRPRRGYFLACDAAEIPTLNYVAPASIQDELIFRIVQARLARDLPDTITQAAILKRFGESRSTVANVLNRMTFEGILKRLKGRGWRFLPGFSGQTSWENVYQFRLIVEPAAILVPHFKVNHEDLKKCRIAHQELLKNANFEREKLGYIFGIDAEFHELVASFSGNALIQHTIQTQNQLRRTLEYYGYSNRRRVADWCGEHLMIIDALERESYAEASMLMREHLSNAMLTVESFWRRRSKKS